MKWFVSTSTPWMWPGMPRRTTHQSWPGVRRRRVSQPSIHLPRDVYLPGMKVPRPGFSRFSFGAKNSSLAAMARPPTRAAARSASSVSAVSSVKGAMATEQGFSSRAGRERAPIVSHDAPEKRRLHEALQPLPSIRGDGVAVPDGVRAQLE